MCRIVQNCQTKLKCIKLVSMPEKNYIFLYFSLLIITPYHTDFLSCCFLYSRFQWNTLTEKKNRNQFLNNGMHYPVANDHYERTSIQFVLPFTRFVSYQFIKHKNSKLASAHSQSRITMAFVFFFSSSLFFFYSLCLFLFSFFPSVFLFSFCCCLNPLMLNSSSRHSRC